MRFGAALEKRIESRFFAVQPEGVEPADKAQHQSVGNRIALPSQNGATGCGSGGKFIFDQSACNCAANCGGYGSIIGVAISRLNVEG